MTWAWYLLQVNIYIGIFYGFYTVFLSRETWFTLNRIYLLAGGTLSLLIPFINPEWILPESAKPGLIISAGQLSMLVTDTSNAADQGISWGGMISAMYFCGIVFFAGRFTWRLLKVGLLIRANPEGMAFSFFGRKVIDTNLPGQDIIHRHEDIHIRQYHTVDIIYFELLGILLWCNPFIYLYKNSIRNIHEYLADEVAAGLEEDKERYALLLLCRAFKVDQSVLTNSFFSQSLIKKRIIMLNKQRSTKTAILKYGLFLPLFAGMLLLSSAKISRNEEIKGLAQQIPAAVPSIFSAVAAGNSGITFSGEPVQQDTTKKRSSKSATMKSTKVRIAPSADSKTISKTGNKTIYDYVSIDTPPSFPGGMGQFYQYIGKSIKYPKEAQDKKVQGQVFLSYVVEKDGTITEVKVERSLGSGTDEEAVRVLAASPKWIPGKRGDQPVRVKYNLPVSFKLARQDTDKPNLNEAPAASPAGNKPGEGARAGAGLTLRGPNAPLIYVDGIKAASNVMTQLDPQTIESISVLKDPAASLSYGPDAKNGVILITLKKEFQNSPSGTTTGGNPQYRAY
jgi:TonB family protein